MGRKIPGRKHRGVKDPDKQAAERFLKIKDKINVPPSNPDVQETPKSLLRIVELKNKTKSGEFNKNRKKKKKNQEYNKYNPGNPAPRFIQRPGESDRDFLRRMNYACMTATREAAYEDKYGVEIKRNEDGEVEAVVKRPKDELEIMLKKIRREKEKKIKKKKKVKGNSEEVAPRLTKSQKWQLKKKEKKLKKQKRNIDEFQKAKDSIKFGETVHAPPSLTAPKKASKDENSLRPGKKNLLLKSMFEGNKEDKTGQKVDVLRKTRNKVIDKKGKRKSLPNAMRRQLDSQQKEIIAAYKELKAKKYFK